MVKGSRNDHLIYNKIQYNLAIALLSSIGWTYTFQENTAFWIGIAIFFMLGFLYGSLSSQFAVQSENISLLEHVLVRLPISLLAGWVTAATILNVAIFLSIDILPQRSDVWAIIMIWVALVIYNVVMIMKKDPIYACVWLYALYAIYSRQNERDVSQGFKTNAAIVMGLHGVSIVGWSYIFFKRAFMNKE